MRRRIIAAVSAAALSMVAFSVPASANPAIIAAWIVAAGLGGLTTGAVVAHNQPPPAQVNYVAPEQQPDTTVVVPQRQCHLTQERLNGVWQQVRICQ